jgi:hypothetical protein
MKNFDCRLLKRTRGEARKIDPSALLRTGWRRPQPVRCSEAVERNEAEIPRNLRYGWSIKNPPE